MNTQNTEEGRERTIPLSSILARSTKGDNMDKEQICIHNKEVNCSKHKCENCGWNPTVTEKRLKAIIHTPQIRRKKVRE